MARAWLFLAVTLLLAAPLRAQPHATPNPRVVDGSDAVVSGAIAGERRNHSGTRRVVLLYDERTDLPGLAILDASLARSLTTDPARSLEVYREAMDLARFRSGTYLPLLRDYLRAKYAAKKIDVVVAAMGPSLDFLLSEGDLVFPGARIVFCGIDRREIEGRALPGHVTGVFLKREFSPTLEAVLRIHPDTTRVVFVAGTSEFDARLVEQARGEFRGYEDRVAFTYLTTLSLRELLAELANLPPHAIVLYSTMFRDGAGEPFVPHEVAERITAAADVPVYGFLDQYLGRGIVGGHLYSLDAHGEQAAELVRQILAGKRPSELPPREGVAGAYQFDWRQMQRWGISESRLPAGSTIVFRRPGIWDLDRPYVISASLLVLLQSAFIAALLVQRTRRVRVERALRESEERFRLMADTTPILVWRSGTDRLCDFFNRPWLEFTGRTMEQELGDGWSEGVWQGDLERCLRTYVTAFDARQPFQMEYRLRRADGVYRWVLDSGVPRHGSDGSFLGYIGSCLDITDRKDSEDALRESQRRYRMATTAGALGVWDWNFATNELYVDPTLKSLLGFEETEITNRPEDWGSRVHPVDAPAAAARVKACIDGETDVYEIEHRMLHKDGSAKWFLSRGSAVRGADGTLHRLVGTKVDITRRKLAEEAIRESEGALQASNREIRHLAGSLITAQDAERARIARDLHDDVSQQLAALSIALSGLKRRVRAVVQDEELQAGVSSIQERAVALADSVRDLSHDLHPDVLKHAGLTAALTAHCAEVSRVQAIPVTCTAVGDFESIGSETAYCLFRIAQEALHNVVKHAGARHAAVRLLRTGDGDELTIADDGRGFDFDEARRNGKGLGLVSIDERVRLAGGTLSVVTERNKGTQVRVRFPASPHVAPVAGDVSQRYETT